MGFVQGGAGLDTPGNTSPAPEPGAVYCTWFTVPKNKSLTNLAPFGSCTACAVHKFYDVLHRFGGGLPSLVGIFWFPKTSRMRACTFTSVLAFTTSHALSSGTCTINYGASLRPDLRELLTDWDKFPAFQAILICLD